MQMGGFPVTQPGDTFLCEWTTSIYRLSTMNTPTNNRNVEPSRRPRDMALHVSCLKPVGAGTGQNNLLVGPERPGIPKDRLQGQHESRDYDGWTETETLFRTSVAVLRRLCRQRRLPRADVTVPPPFLTGAPRLCLHIGTVFGLLPDLMIPERLFPVISGTRLLPLTRQGLFVVHCTRPSPRRAL